MFSHCCSVVPCGFEVTGIQLAEESMEKAHRWHAKPNLIPHWQKLVTWLPLEVRSVIWAATSQIQPSPMEGGAQMEGAASHLCYKGTSVKNAILGPNEPGFSLWFSTHHCVNLDMLFHLSEPFSLFWNRDHLFHRMVTGFKWDHIHTALVTVPGTQWTLGKW